LSPPPRTESEPKRGEIWRVRFDPARWAEIGKERPAVVSPNSVGKLPLRIVVPITGWDLGYATAPWHVGLRPSRRNGLSKTSSADCFQVKSISLERFEAKLGDVEAEDLEEISAAIAICVGA
jgi:mRNA interferase MazF